MHPAPAVLIGLLVGALPALLIRAVIKVGAERPAQVKLRPVTVLARPLPPGAVVTTADLTLRSLPAEWLTASVVKPESASYVVNQSLLVPLAAGEPISWSAFATIGTIEGSRPAEELIDACEAELARRNVPTAPGTVAELRATVLGGPR